MKTRVFTSRKIFTTALILFLAAGMSSCLKTDYWPCIRPLGPVVTEERNVYRDFDAIDLTMHAKVIVKYGTEQTILIHAAENLLEVIETRTVGNELIIDQNQCIQASSNAVIIEITTPYLSALRVSGSGKIILDDVFESEFFHLVVSGSGEIEGEIYGEELNVVISGSGKIEAYGAFDEQQITISGSGEVLNADLYCHEAHVVISGSGDAYVHAEHYLRALISGSGNVYYFGDPHISSTISGSGHLISINP